MIGIKKRIYSISASILLLLSLAAAFGPNRTAQAADIQQKKDGFIMETAIIDAIEGKIDDEKFDEIKKLKGKEVTEKSLSAVLKELALEKDEIDFIFDYIRGHLKFISIIKKAAPIALLVRTSKNNILEKEAGLENVQLKEEKEKISSELKGLQKDLKKHEKAFSGKIKGIDWTRAAMVPEIVESLDYTNDEKKIIADHFQQHALFEKKIHTLNDMIQSIDAINTDIKTNQYKLRKARTEEEKKNISKYLSELNTRLQKTQNDFSIITTGIDHTGFLKKENRDVNWEKELKDIFAPVMVELKEVTERPRKIEKLRSDIFYYEQRIPQVNKAIEEIDKFLEKVTNKKVRARLERWKAYWQQLEKEFITQREAAQHQIIAESRNKQSLWQSLRNFFDSFVKHRGKNIFFAILAFIVVFLLFRFLQRLVRKHSPLHRSAKYMLWANISDLMFMILTFAAASAALLIVLYMTGDWLVLAIMILLFIGILWSARNTLPRFVEQIRLMLGFGPVRQGERITIAGIPYQVESIGVFSYFNNPLLTNGTLRLPIEDLIGMRSRPCKENEAWFPCKKGDCILFNGNRRVIAEQTPEHVILDYVGSPEPIATSMFLSQDIRNLSAEDFWTGVTFYLNYKYRDIAMTEVIDLLKAKLTERMKKENFHDQILSYWIELGELTDVSMGILVWLQCKKELAVKYSALKMMINQTIVSVSAEQKWDIPFHQLMLHYHNNEIPDPDKPNTFV